VLDDPGEREQWHAMLRPQVTAYLASQRISHGAIGEVPAWYVFPHISIWAVESANAAGWVGWWVICGDCPTDYVTCTGDRTPRSAVEELAVRWREGAAVMMRGQPPLDWSVGNSGDISELAPLLASRAELLVEWSRDDDLWD
jgi:Domain of unknown function (DUF4826)